MSKIVTIQCHTVCPAYYYISGVCVFLCVLVSTDNRARTNYSNPASVHARMYTRVVFGGNRCAQGQLASTRVRAYVLGRTKNAGERTVYL